MQFTEQYFRLEALLEMEQTKLKISSIRGGMEHLLTDVGAPVSWPAGVNEKYQTSNRYDVLRWTLIADNASYLEYDLKNSRPLCGMAKSNLVTTSIFPFEFRSLWSLVSVSGLRK